MSACKHRKVVHAKTIRGERIAICVRCLAARKRYLYRSAITGRFVRPAYAKRYPQRTVREVANG